VERLMAILSLESVGRVFGSGPQQVVALNDVSLRVAPGEFVAIMGPSGSGKSTLLQLAGGLDRPTSGQVLLAGRDLADMSRAELALAHRRQVGFVFQDVNLLPTLTAAENLALPLELDGTRPRAAIAGARHLLEASGLGELADRFPERLSGGERQRVAIARAVTGGRTVLLADEPTGALDSISGESVMRMLRQRCAAGCAIVLVTHDMRHAAWADRTVFLRDGRVIDEASLLADPAVLLQPGRAW
jgi:putative ABC transport system ATP-binding protein